MLNPFNPIANRLLAKSLKLIQLSFARLPSSGHFQQFLGSQEVIVPLYIQQRRRSSAESRKSFRKLVFANADLEDFQMDPEKLEKIQQQRRASHASNTENRRFSDDNRSDSLCIPGSLGPGSARGSVKSLRDEESSNSGMTHGSSFERRASFSSRRGSTVISFDPSEMPNVQMAKQNLKSSQPGRSSLRRPSRVVPVESPIIEGFENVD